MEYIAGCKRDFKPQTGFQYSCLNFITLQHYHRGRQRTTLRDLPGKRLRRTGYEATDYLPLPRDKNGKWINTVPLPENIAPTEKQPDGQVLLRTGCTTRLRILNGGISAMQAHSPAPKDIFCAALQKWRRVERTSHFSPQGEAPCAPYPVRQQIWAAHRVGMYVALRIPMPAISFGPEYLRAYGLHRYICRNRPRQ